MSAAPTILYRALDENGDIVWGQGVYNFLTDTEAVAQLILTRLRLFEGEWWSDLTDGLPLWQKIIAVTANINNIVLAFRQRIVGTPYVTSITNVVASFDSTTRAFSYSATVTTQFGTTIQVSFPTPPSQGLPS